MDALHATISEVDFADLVSRIEADPSRRPELEDLLRNDHEIYRQRGVGATVRMRGWVLLAIARSGLAGRALIYILEELDNGRDAYLVAAAARALQSCGQPDPAYAPFLARAIVNIRLHDDAVSFDHYDGYADGNDETTALREILETVRWMGPAAKNILTEIEEVRENRYGEIPSEVVTAAADAIEAIGQKDSPEGCCCDHSDTVLGFRSWEPTGQDSSSIDETVFEDQSGQQIKFGDYFHGYPSIVTFFYTRCDNPQRCSLTIAKFAGVQKRLEQQSRIDQVRTAAITYDPEYDLPSRMELYGRNRGVRMDSRHRMLRAIKGFGAVREYFALGVNYVESLINRHRIELYILDKKGRIAASFTQVQWDEQQVEDAAVALLAE